MTDLQNSTSTTGKNKLVVDHATLKEIANLIKEVNFESTRSNARISFKLVYIDNLRGKYAFKDLGTVYNMTSTSDDDINLDDARFVIGDFLDVGVFHGVPPRVPERRAAFFHHAQMVPKAHYRERVTPAGAGAAEVSPKIIGKRKASAYDFDESMGESKSPPTSPRMVSHSTQEMEKEYSLVKRTKMSNEKEFPLSKLLATLDKPQLLSLINNLIDTHPNLQSEIASNIPRPTIQSVTNILTSLEKKYQDSFPYTKWGHSKDDYSFNRVKPALLELKGAILDYAAHFTSPDEFPINTFTFLHLATNYTHRLPDWDNSTHNELKHEIYVKLDDFWKKAIINAASKLREGKLYGQTVVNEWVKNLAQHDRDSNGMFRQAIDEFTQKLGWIIGLQNGSTQHNIYFGMPV
ncbi:2681_t:CDS:2 [Gigaspora margarita]|uniref:Tethering factor for nuclear proteasome STS1 n=1 Tax=Gigaspora margarita TaxID=4874 RepID=A0ABN7UIZ3_GIGMA|nr:2681_t:CDS:2 [Gigaspora margarita]